VHSFKIWRHYFAGAATPVEVYTDYNNLRGIKTVARLNPRQARWAVFLGQFDFEIHYRPGKTNLADGPSRRPDYWTENQAVNDLLPTLKHKLDARSRASATIGIVTTRRRTASRPRGPTTDNRSGTPGETPGGEHRDKTPIADAARYTQRVSRSEARDLVKECNADGLPGVEFKKTVEALQNGDAFCQSTKTEIEHYRGTPGGKAKPWSLDSDGLLR
jgi:hypothetical protein